ncbi:hypothetical protein [Curtobacterium sp. AB7]|uniref:hypothetical protein n=1 Tax=Curtobacterium sp. AB7 TaxID=3349327 RepID=UPI00384B14FA
MKRSALPDDVPRRSRGWWLLGLAFCSLVFLEVFAVIGSLPGMLVAQTQYMSCGSVETMRCSYAVGDVAELIVPLCALVVAITTWVIGVFGAPTLRRRVLTPAIGLVVIVLIFVFGVVAINLSIR